MSNDEYRYENHRLYGRVRLLKRSARGRDAKIYEWWEYDASYRPKVPTGAVPGDPTKQHYCAAHHVPKFFYLDETRTCVECGEAFVFAADEQRFWYETLRFNFNSIAIRCRRCRTHRRGIGALNTQVQHARASAATDSESPTAHLDVAEALLRLRQRTGHGNLDDAISAARRARELWPDNPEPDFWEGLAQLLSGRYSQAASLLRSFLRHPAARTFRRQTLVREAESLIGGDAGAG